MADQKPATTTEVGPTSTTLADVRAINQALKRAPFDPDSARVSACNRRALWDALLRHVHHEILHLGRAALVARPAAKGVALYVVGAEGRMRGAFRDPLGLAQAMFDLGLERVALDGAQAASQLPVVVKALLGGPFGAVPGTGLYESEGHFVDQVDDRGLPLLPGVQWVEAQERSHQPGPPRSLDGLDAQVRRLPASRLVDLLDGLNLEQAGELDCGILRRQVMARARAFNEGANDVASATALWSWCARTASSTRDRSSIIAIMRAVARKRSEGHRGSPDIAGAVHIWQAVHRISPTENERLRLVKSMMKVANVLTDLAGPWEAVDVPGAVLIWQGVWRLHHSPEDDERVLRTMMDIANKFTDLRSSRELHLEPAITIWRGIVALEPSEDDRERTLATMMDLARRFSDDDTSPGLQGAIRLWREVYGLECTADNRLGVVKHMMAEANRRSQAAEATDQRDLQGATAIWMAVLDLAEDDDERQRVLLTMLSVARAMADHLEIRAALVLWDAAARAGDARFGLRTLKNVLGQAASSPVFAAQAAQALAGPEAPPMLPGFHGPLLAGLRYYANDLEGVLRQAEASDHLSVQALAADALRKLKRIDEAIERANDVIRRASPGPDIVAQDATVSALCCRAYCLLEQSRAGDADPALALTDLDAALMLAEQAALPVPPRIHTGRGYVLEALGRDEDARAAFAEALRLDEDNRKALLAGAGDGGTESIQAAPLGLVGLAAFEAAVEGASDPQHVVGLLRAQLRPGVDGAALEPYSRAVMTCARRFNEVEGRLDAAIVLWTSCAEVLEDPEDHERILAVMRAVARKLSEGARVRRDLAGAVRILMAVHQVARDPDQRLRVLKSMMHVANLHSDLDGPWATVDIAAAVTFWRGAWRLHHSQDDDERVVRTMMTVAAKLEGAGEQGTERHAEAAMIRRAVSEMETLG